MFRLLALVGGALAIDITAKSETSPAPTITTLADKSVEVLEVKQPKISLLKKLGLNSTKSVAGDNFDDLSEKDQVKRLRLLLEELQDKQTVPGNTADLKIGTHPSGLAKVVRAPLRLLSKTRTSSLEAACEEVRPIANFWQIGTMAGMLFYSYSNNSTWFLATLAYWVMMSIMAMVVFPQCNQRLAN